MRFVHILHACCGSSAPRCARGGASVQQHARAQAGFTLVELVAAIAILAILGTMVTTAMVTGSRIMASTMAESNASVLSQSIDTALSDVLRYASAQVTQGAPVQDRPPFDTDSYFDVQGSPVRDGQLTIDTEGHLALATDAGLQSIPKAAGIYTDFEVVELAYEYNCETNVYTGTYTLAMRDGDYTRTCAFACRSMVEETVAY